MGHIEMEPPLMDPQSNLNPSIPKIKSFRLTGVTVYCEPPFFLILTRSTCLHYAPSRKTPTIVWPSYLTATAAIWLQRLWGFGERQRRQKCYPRCGLKYSTKLLELWGPHGIG